MSITVQQRLYWLQEYLNTPMTEDSGQPLAYILGNNDALKEVARALDGLLNGNLVPDTQQLSPLPWEYSWYIPKVPGGGTIKAEPHHGAIYRRMDLNKWVYWNGQEWLVIEDEWNE